jgi:hypothetical protein
MGIISVITNCYLASIYLNEHLSDNQKKGYLVILSAVIGILFISPKESTKPPRYDYLITLFQNLGFKITAFVIIVLLCYFIWRTLYTKNYRISSYVAICSLFGTIIISSAKMLTLIARSTFTENQSNENNSSSNTSIFPYVITILLVSSIISQEFFKQHAYSRFKVSQFNAMLYAGLNSWYFPTKH